MLSVKCQDMLGTIGHLSEHQAPFNTLQLAEVIDNQIYHSIQTFILQNGKNEATLVKKASRYPKTSTTSLINVFDICKLVYIL